MSPRSQEYNKRLDVIVNLLNIGLIILAGFLIGFGSFYISQSQYPYLINLGAIMVACGLFAILVGGWGFRKHYKMMKKMKLQAKLDLNY